MENVESKMADLHWRLVAINQNLDANASPDGTVTIFYSGYSVLSVPLSEVPGDMEIESLIPR